jgi:hypothetical protein
MRHPELSYRLVAGADMYKVRQLLDAIGEPQPHFLLSCAWVAESPDGRIVGLSQFQSIPVVEPFKMISSDYDGGEVLGKLFSMTREFIMASGTPRVLMHTGHPAMKRMLTGPDVRAQRMSDEFFDWRKQA